MKKTTNYQLNLYEATDDFLRTDFNNDNEKLDTALTALAAYRPYVTGTYTGNSIGRPSTAQSINLGFRPKAVLIFSPRVDPETGDYATPGSRMAFFLDGVDISYSGKSIATVYDSGFTVSHYVDTSYYYSPVLNYSGAVYSYIAFR